MSSTLDKKAIGDRIEKRLREVGLKKGEFATLLDRDATRMSSYFRGDDLTLDMIGEIADHLKCSVSWLIDGEEKPAEIL